MTAKEKREARKNKRNKRVASHRLLKNILIWLCGFLFIPTIVAVAIFAIPLKTFVGGTESGVVSDDVANKSIGSAIASYRDFSFGDFAIIANTLNDAIQSTEYKDIIKFDADAFNKIKLANIGAEGFSIDLKNSFEIDATLNKVSTIFSLELGNFFNMPIFQNFEEVPVAEKPDISTEFNEKNYYYKNSESKYLRAFTDDGAYVDGVDSDTTLYYAALGKVNVMDLPLLLPDGLSRCKVKDIITSIDPSFDENSTTAKIVKERTIQSLMGLTSSDIYLADIIGATSNDKLWTVILDATGATNREDVTLEILSTLDVGKIKIASVMPDLSEEMKKVLQDCTSKTFGEMVVEDLGAGCDVGKIKLNTFIESDNAIWNILIDSTGKTDINTITLGDANNFNIGNVKLGSVIKSKTNNRLVDALLKRNPKVSELGTVINSMSLYEVYGDMCFTKNIAEARSTTEKYSLSETASGAVYTLDAAAGEYYISKNAGMWIIICFNGNGTTQSDGKSTVYSQRDFTVETLQSDSNEITEAIQNSSVKDLMDAGIMPTVGMSNATAKKSFKQFITDISPYL